jgi:hypothetical protein
VQRKSASPPPGGQLRQPLLQFLAVVVAGRVLNCRADLMDARVYIRLVAGATDNRGCLTGADHPVRSSELVEPDLFEIDAEFLGDQLSAGQHRDVLQHGAAAVAKARRLDRQHPHAAAQLVDHEGGQGFIGHVLGDHQDRRGLLHRRLQKWDERAEVGELLVVQQHVDVFQLAGQPLEVGHEVR